MKNLSDYLTEALLNESIEIEDNNSPEFESFVQYILKYSKSLKIKSEEKKRYESKGTPITKEIAQDLLSKRLYNNVSVRYKVDPDFFLEVCNELGITINMSNLGFGKEPVIKWIEPTKKIDPKKVYFDDVDIVWYDKTVGFRWDDGGLEFLPDYEDRAEEFLAIIKKKFKYDDWYIVKK